jgi:hypothetical protein
MEPPATPAPAAHAREEEEDQDEAGRREPARMSASTWNLASSLRVLSRPVNPADVKTTSRALRTAVRQWFAAYYRDLNVAASRVERHYTVLRGFAQRSFLCRMSFFRFG